MFSRQPHWATAGATARVSVSIGVYQWLNLRLVRLSAEILTARPLRGLKDAKNAKI